MTELYGSGKSPFIFWCCIGEFKAIFSSVINWYCMSFDMRIWYKTDLDSNKILSSYCHDRCRYSENDLKLNCPYIKFRCCSSAKWIEIIFHNLAFEQLFFFHTERHQAIVTHLLLLFTEHETPFHIHVVAFILLRLELRLLCGLAAAAAAVADMRSTLAHDRTRLIQ